MLFKVVSAIVVTSIVTVSCDNAQYAPGYSESAFKRVHLGMSIDEVKKILGEPLLSEPSVPGEVWRYGVVSADENGPRAWTFSVGKPVVVFNEAGSVERSFEANDVKAEMSREQVREKLGEPSARRVLSEVVWLHYSLPAESGRSDIRIVGINREGKVSNISSYSTVD